MGLLTGPGSKPRVGKMLTGRLFALWTHLSKTHNQDPLQACIQ
jgi:hypothetical protein